MSFFLSRSEYIIMRLSKDSMQSNQNETLYELGNKHGKFSEFASE